MSYGLISSTTKSDPSISTKGEYNPNQDGMMGMFYYVAPNTKPIFLNINTVNHEARAYELELPKGGGTIQIGDTRYAYQDAQGSEKDAHPIIRIDQHPVPYILRANLPVGATVIIPLGKVNVDNDLAVDSFPIEDDLIVLIPGSKIILLDGTEICVAGEIIQTIEAKVQTVIVSLRNELLKKI